MHRNIRKTFIMAVSIILLMLLFVAAVDSTAEASTVKCRSGHFSPGLYALDLRAHDLPRRTDHYAPRCLVAEAAAGVIARRWERTLKAPRSIRVYGARWNGGRWSVRVQWKVLRPEYTSPDPCFTITQGRKRITFIL